MLFFQIKLQEFSTLGTFLELIA